VRRQISVLTLILLVISSASLWAITADEVMERHIEAKGGLDKLKQLKTVAMKGKMIMESLSGTMETYQKAPNLRSLRVNLQSGITYQEGCDGKNIWALGPMGFKTFEGEKLKERLEQSQIEPLLGFTERGGKYEYVGIDSMNGIKCYKIRFIQGSSDTTLSYFDTKNYHMIKTEVETPRGVSEQLFDEFRMVDGILFPFQIRSLTQSAKTKITFSEIIVNQPIPDSFFVMPDSTLIPPRMIPLPDSLRGKPVNRGK
jgi:outer membrane lipoprotein-sorting protein